MIDCGNYREVIPWITGGVAIALVSLMGDAPGDEQPRHAAVAGDLVDVLGFGSPAGRAKRFRQIAEAGSALFELADEIVASRPDELITA